MDELESHAFALGQIIGNLHTLEFLLRVFLGQMHTERYPSSTAINLDRINVGDKVPENYLTNYDTLGKLVHNYNNLVSKSAPELQIDMDIVQLRDALAHGRVSSATPSPPFRLLKFDKPQQGFVKVTYALDMTPAWLSAQINHLRDAAWKVSKANSKISQSQTSVVG